MAENEKDVKVEEKKISLTEKQLEERLQKAVGLSVQKKLDEIELNEIKGTPKVLREIKSSIQVNEKTYPFGRLIRAKLYQQAYRKEQSKDITLEKALEFYGGKDATVNQQILSYNTKDIMAGSDLAAGGVFIPTEFYNQVIPLLYAETIMLKAGVQTIQLDKSNLTIPKEASGFIVQRVGEVNTANTAVSDPTFSEINLSLKKLMGIGRITNDLLRYNTYNADARAQNMLIKAMALKQDLDWFYGIGSTHTPNGVINQITAANKTTCTVKSAATAATIKQDLIKLKTLVTKNNVDDTNGFYVSDVATLDYIRTQAYTTGYPAEYTAGLSEPQPKFFGKNWFTSTQINSHNIFYLVPDWILAGLGINMQLEVFLNATYIDNAGTVHAGINEDISVFRCISEDDIGMGQKQAGSYFTNCDWQY